MILFLTTMDTDILTLREAIRRLPSGFPQIRSANLTDWQGGEEEASRYLDEHLPQSLLVVLRLLGGRKAHPYTFDRVVAHCRENGIPLLGWPGEAESQLEMKEATSVPPQLSHQAHTYALLGGVDNFHHMLLFLSNTWLGTAYSCGEPQEVPWSGIYSPLAAQPLNLREWMESHHHAGRPIVGLLFYRAHWMSRNLAFIDAIIEELRQQGLDALPVFCHTLKASNERSGTAHFLHYFVDGEGRSVVDSVISTMSFSISSLNQGDVDLASLSQLDVPVFQAIVSLGDRATWEQHEMGISPLDTGMNVAMPEFDGRIITVPISFKEKLEEDELLKSPVRLYVPVSDRVSFLSRLVSRWVRLQRKQKAQRRIAILLTNYPSKNSRIGNAVGLDTPASVVHILETLKDEGYNAGDTSLLPKTGDELIHRLIERCSNDRDYLTEQQLALAEGHISADRYYSAFSNLSSKAQNDLQETWGEPPGSVFLYEGQLVIPGIRFGNIFVGLQPPRGFGDNPVAVYHSPDLVPTHHYVAYYRWLRDVFQADAVIHAGKHGTLEWLPGKGIGLSAACFPEVVLQDLPNFYPYIINNPGEGTQAKRRSHATIIDHMVPVLTQAETYDDLSRLEQLLDEYYQVQTLDPQKLPLIQEEIWQTILHAQLHRDLQQEAPPAAEQFDHFLQEVDGYLCELKASQIRDGLHTLGQPPQDERAWGDMLFSLLALPNGSLPSLPETLAGDLGLDWSVLQSHLGAPWEQEVPLVLRQLSNNYLTCGDLSLGVQQLARTLLSQLPATVQVPREWETSYPQAAPVLRYAKETLIPKVQQIENEIGSLMHGLEGRFVQPGPSGSPTRGMADILPTGRNFYSVDPWSLPSPAAWQVGQQLAANLIAKYLQEKGNYPDSVGIVVWGTAAMRTRGDDIAEIFSLLGVRPVWQKESRRVRGLEVIPLEELQRPRIDVTVRISGFFRDAFPNLIHLLHQAVEQVAHLEEPLTLNFVRKHYLEELEQLQLDGLSAEEAEERSLYRIFGSKPGAYGSGLLPLIESRNWQNEQDLAQVYLTWSGYAYTPKDFGRSAVQAFKRRLKGIQIATKNQDNREHDIFDSDDYFQEHGGMVATIRSLTGSNPEQYFGDTSNPQSVHVRHLSAEALRVFRTRVINPKWLESVQRHGYKGALEMANTVDFLFGYDATSQIVEDWMYEALAQSYALSGEMQEFFHASNPWALKEIAERLLEAAQRGMWEKPQEETLAQLAQLYLQVEEWIEEGSGNA